LSQNALKDISGKWVHWSWEDFAGEFLEDQDPDAGLHVKQQCTVYLVFVWLPVLKAPVVLFLALRGSLPAGSTCFSSDQSHESFAVCTTMSIVHFCTLDFICEWR
jgi:hypothetical protein